MIPNRYSQLKMIRMDIIKLRRDYGRNVKPVNERIDDLLELIDEL